MSLPSSSALVASGTSSGPDTLTWVRRLPWKHPVYQHGTVTVRYTRGSKSSFQPAAKAHLLCMAHTAAPSLAQPSWMALGTGGREGKQLA